MSHISESDHRRLEATVFPDCVVESHQITDAAQGWRRVQVTKLWRTERVIGRGAFGEVVLQTLDNDSGKQRALKAIRGVKKTRNECQMELKAMIEFTKPKYQSAAVFVEFFGWFQNPKDDTMYLAMEYIPGGDLEAYILDIESSTENGPAIPEYDVKEITSQILEGLKIMHAEGYAHRDLKPKNIFVVQRRPDWWIKLGDFGLAKQVTEATAYRTQAGTQQYMAPEFFCCVPGLNQETSEYTNAVDIWALGCIVHRILTRSVPFPKLFMLSNYSNGNKERLFDALLPMAQAEAFVRQLLIPHPAQRPTATAALEHSWILLNSKYPVTFSYAVENFDTNMEGQIGYNPASHPGLKSYRSPSQTHNTNVESQSGYNSASHLGLKSYQSAPQTHNASRSPLNQEAALEPLLEPDSKLNPTQRPLSSSSKPRLSNESQSSLTQKPVPIRIRSRPEGSGHLNVAGREAEKDTDDEARDREDLIELRVAVDKGQRNVTEQPTKDSAGNAKERSPEYLIRYEASDGENHQNEETTKLRIRNDIPTEVKSTGAIVVQEASKVGLRGRALQNEVDVATILPQEPNTQQAPDLNEAPGGEEQKRQTLTGVNALHSNIAQNEAAAQLLLQHGHDVKQKDLDKEKALLWAASSGHEAAVQLLLEKGANIEAKNEFMMTALHYAAYGGRETVLQLLLEKGADIKAKDAFMMTALHYAAQCGREAAVQLLLEKGADIEAKGKFMKTALHYAAQLGHEATMQLLLEKGADIEAKCKFMKTALHYAAQLGHEATMQLLLEKGADIDAKSHSMMTALHYAAREGQKAAVQLLFEKGALIKAKSVRGMTALDYAGSEKYESIVYLLSPEPPSLFQRLRWSLLRNF